MKGVFSLSEQRCARLLRKAGRKRKIKRARIPKEKPNQGESEHPQTRRDCVRFCRPAFTTESIGPIHARRNKDGGRSHVEDTLSLGLRALSFSCFFFLFSLPLVPSFLLNLDPPSPPPPSVRLLAFLGGASFALSPPTRPFFHFRARLSPRHGDGLFAAK